MNIYIYEYIHIFMHSYIHHIYTHICIHTCIRFPERLNTPQMCIHIYMYMNTVMHIRIHTYMNTFTHSYIDHIYTYIHQVPGAPKHALDLHAKVSRVMFHAVLRRLDSAYLMLYIHITHVYMYEYIHTFIHPYVHHVYAYYTQAALGRLDSAYLMLYQHITHVYMYEYIHTFIHSYIHTFRRTSYIYILHTASTWSTGQCVFDANACSCCTCVCVCVCVCIGGCVTPLSLTHTHTHTHIVPKSAVQLSGTIITGLTNSRTQQLCFLQLFFGFAILYWYFKCIFEIFSFSFIFSRESE